MDGLKTDQVIPQGMRPGRRELNEASVMVSMTEAVPAKMRPNVREVSHLFVPVEARGRKLATVLMNLICQEADSNGITLVLTASPYDDQGPNEETLVAWYARFGFTVLQDVPTGIFMARQVHEAPRIKPVNQIRAAVQSAIVH